MLITKFQYQKIFKKIAKVIAYLINQTITVCFSNLLKTRRMFQQHNDIRNHRLTITPWRFQQYLTEILVKIVALNHKKCVFTFGQPRSLFVHVCPLLVEPHSSICTDILCGWPPNGRHVTFNFLRDRDCWYMSSS